jgi:hypothetical protein
MKALMMILIFFVSSSIYSQHLDFAYEIGGNEADVSYEMAIDSLKNIYITGGFCNEVDFNPNGTPTFLNSKNIDRSNTYVAKYDSSFNLIWAFSIKGDAWWEIGHCLKIDDSLNVYIVGNYEGNADFDPSENQYELSSPEMSYYLAKYNSNGEFRWVKDIGNYPESFLVVPPRSKINIDNNSNIYLSHVDSLHKYNSSGNLLWSKGLKGNAVYDGDGSLYTLVKSGNPWSDYKYDSLKLVKIDTSGQVLIEKIIISNPVGDINGYLTFDNTGNLLINGDYWGTSIFYSNNQNFILNNSDIECCPIGPGQGCSDCPLYHEYFAKYDTIGNVIWTYDFGANGPNPHIIETTSNGNIFTIGRLNFSADFDHTENNAYLTNSGSGYYIAKYNVSCDFISATSFMGGSYNDFISDFKIINTSTAYICGHFFNTINLDLNGNISQLSTSPPEDIFIAKYSNFDINDFTTELAEVKINSNVIVYPNPTNRYFNIKHDLITLDRVSIYNISGQTILSIENYNNNPIDISSVSVGFYMIKIETKDKIITQKILKY